MNLESNNGNLPENGQVTGSVNGEPLSPNEPVTGSQTENVDVTITDNKPGPEDTQEESEEKQHVLVDEHSYASDLAGRIVLAGRTAKNKMRKVGVHEDDFIALTKAGLLDDDDCLKIGGQFVVIQEDADTKGTFWDKSEQ